MPVIYVSDPDDPRLAPFRDIRERDLARRDGLFIAEGKVVIDAALDRDEFRSARPEFINAIDSKGIERDAGGKPLHTFPHPALAAGRYPFAALLVLDRRLPLLAGTVARLPHDVPVYVATQAVIDRVAGFHLHRGILALARRPADIDPRALIEALPENCVVPVLVGIANHDNVGSIFRNAAAFNAPLVLLDPTCCDPLYRKAIRVSVGGALRIPFARVESFMQAHALLAAAGFRQYALSPSGRATVNDVRPGGRVALYLGTEGEGLPPELMGTMETLRIPMSRAFDSLNVAAASAIAMSRFYEGE